MNGGEVFAHCLRTARDDLGRFATNAQCSDEGRDLRRRRFACHDLAQCRMRLLVGEGFVVDEFGYGFTNHV